LSCKPIFWPHDLLMQPTGTVWTILIEDHLGIIPVKFGQNPMSGFKGEVAGCQPGLSQNIGGI